MAQKLGREERGLRWERGRWCWRESGEHGGEDGSGGAGGVVPVYDDGDGRRGCGCGGVQIVGESGDERALGAVSVEAEGEVLGKLKGPLGEGAGVKVVEEGDGVSVGVFVAGYKVVVGGMGEQRERGEGI